MRKAEHSCMKRVLSFVVGLDKAVQRSLVTSSEIIYDKAIQLSLVTGSDYLWQSNSAFTGYRFSSFMAHGVHAIPIPVWQPWVPSPTKGWPQHKNLWYPAARRRSSHMDNLSVPCWGFIFYFFNLYSKLLIFIHVVLSLSIVSATPIITFSILYTSENWKKKKRRIKKHTIKQKQKLFYVQGILQTFN